MAANPDPIFIDTNVLNTDDFKRFAHLITVVPLVEDVAIP